MRKSFFLNFLQKIVTQTQLFQLKQIFKCIPEINISKTIQYRTNDYYLLSSDNALCERFKCFRLGRSERVRTDCFFVLKKKEKN